MSVQVSIQTKIKDLEKRLDRAMPKVRREIGVFERKKALGKLTKNPKVGPQFNV